MINRLIVVAKEKYDEIHNDIDEHLRAHGMLSASGYYRLVYRKHGFDPDTDWLVREEWPISETQGS